MKTLHIIAIRFGWYRDITTGLPLNVCKTVFGTYFLECDLKPIPVGKIAEVMYKWGFDDAKHNWHHIALHDLSSWEESLNSGPVDDEPWSEKLNAVCACQSAVREVVSYME